MTNVNKGTTSKKNRIKAQNTKALNVQGSGLEREKMIISIKQFSKSISFRQPKNLNKERTGLVHISRALQSLVLEWDLKGRIPEGKKEEVFRAVGLFNEAFEDKTI